MVFHDDDRSTDAQVLTGEQWVRSWGGVVVETYAEPNRSASAGARRKAAERGRVSRPAWARMVEDACADPGSCVLVAEHDRAWRDDFVTATTLELFEMAGVGLIVGTKLYDLANSGDRMVITVMGSVAATYSRTLSVKVLDAKQRQADAGRPTSLPPYGYRRTYRGDGTVRIMDGQVPDGDLDFSLGAPPSPAQVVRMIFDWYDQGLGLTDICRRLTEREIPGPRGGGWSASSVAGILDNPAYVGGRVHRGQLRRDVIGDWRPLVGEDVWHRVRARRITAAPRARGLSRRAWPLSGVLLCSVCGRPLTRATATARPGRPSYYLCAGHGCERGCLVTIEAASAERYVLPIMRWWITERAAAGLVAPPDYSPELAALRVTLARYRADLAELPGLVGSGEMSPRLAGAAEADLTGRIEVVEDKINALSSPLATGPIGPEVATRWTDGTVADRRALMAELAEIKVRPVRNGRGGWPVPPPVDRIEWRWINGEPYDGVVPPDGLPVLDRAYYALLDAPMRTARRDAAALRRQAWTDSQPDRGKRTSPALAPDEDGWVRMDGQRALPSELDAVAALGDEANGWPSLRQIADATGWSVPKASTIRKHLALGGRLRRPGVASGASGRLPDGTPDAGRTGEAIAGLSAQRPPRAPA